MQTKYLYLEEYFLNNLRDSVLEYLVYPLWNQFTLNLQYTEVQGYMRL